MRALYPLFLKLDGKRVLIVGGGTVAAHKARDLLEAGAAITAVSLAFVADFPAVSSRVERAFQPGDCAGASIVVAATGDTAVDDVVVKDAHLHGALVNVVDHAELSDFYTGGVVRRGPLAVVVGTSGASPALARKVRQHLERVLPVGLGDLASALGDARPRLLARYPAFAERARVLDHFVERFFDAQGSAENGAVMKDDFGSREIIDTAVETELLSR